MDAIRSSRSGVEPGGRDLDDTVFALPADSVASGIARRHLVEHADALPRELIDDALLMVSELVANAVQHGKPDIVLRIRRSPPGIGVSVQDRGAERPVPPTDMPDPRAAQGRGLCIVDALSSSWGIEPMDPPPGKIVWFELERTSYSTD